jgi:hypothetical protein
MIEPPRRQERQEKKRKYKDKKGTDKSREARRLFPDYLSSYPRFCSSFLGVLGVLAVPQESAPCPR